MQLFISSYVTEDNWLVKDHWPGCASNDKPAVPLPWNYKGGSFSFVTGLQSTPMEHVHAKPSVEHRCCMYTPHIQNHTRVLVHIWWIVKGCHNSADDQVFIFMPSICSKEKSLNTEMNSRYFLLIGVFQFEQWKLYLLMKIYLTWEMCKSFFQIILSHHLTFSFTDILGCFPRS